MKIQIPSVAWKEGRGGWLQSRSLPICQQGDVGGIFCLILIGKGTPLIQDKEKPVNRKLCYISSRSQIPNGQYTDHLVGQLTIEYHEY